jgi:hypothetical protein
MAVAALSGCAGRVTGAGSADPSVSPARAGADVAYRTVKKPCDLLDAKSLVARYGEQLDGLPYQNEMGWRGERRLDCALAFDGARGLTRVDVVAHIFEKPGLSREAYEGLREAQQGRFPLDDISGVGRRAHSYTEAVTGHHLYLYDGNAYLSLGLNAIDDGAEVGAEEARTVLVAQARHALLALTPRVS